MTIDMTKLDIADVLAKHREIGEKRADGVCQIDFAILKEAEDEIRSLHALCQELADPNLDAAGRDTLAHEYPWLFDQTDPEEDEIGNEDGRWDDHPYV